MCGEAENIRAREEREKIEVREKAICLGETQALKKKKRKRRDGTFKSARLRSIMTVHLCHISFSGDEKEEEEEERKRDSA